MLNAMLSGKKVGSGLAGLSLLDSFDGSEDLLTSSFLERLFYFEDEVIQDIFLSPQLWPELGYDRNNGIQEVLFWPKFDLLQQTVEPDCVIIFNECIVVIEAKRWDYQMQQNPEQLAREYLAVKNKYADKDILILCVGGLGNDQPQTIGELKTKTVAVLDKLTQANTFNVDIRLAGISWANLLELTRNSVSLENSNAARRILIDIESALDAHGLSKSTPVWLCELTDDVWRKFRLLPREIPTCFAPAVLVPKSIESVPTPFTSSKITTEPSFFWNLR